MTEFNVAESVVLPVIPVVDYRQQVVSALDLIGMESMIDDLCIQWVDAYREERDAKRELESLRDLCAKRADVVRASKSVEIAQAIKDLGRSTKDERAALEELIIAQDDRFRALVKEVAGAEDYLENAKATLVIVQERRKDAHMKYRGRETIVDFFTTVARIPFAPDEDGIVRPLAPSVEREAGPDQMRAIQEAVAGGMSAAEAVRRSFDPEEVQTGFEDTLPKDEEGFRVSL